MLIAGNGHIISEFYEALVVVRPEFEPIIKMLVSLREETFVEPQDNESTDNQSEAIDDNQRVVSDDCCEPERVSPKAVTEAKATKPVRSPVKKKLKFDSTDDETDISSNESFDTNSRRKTKTLTNITQKRVASTESDNSCAQKEDRINRTNRRVTESNSQISPQKERRHEYKTLLEVHSLLPVSGKTYCHIYGILRYRDFKQNLIYLRDEKAYTFSIKLMPGKTTLRDYPAFKPADILRIHRILITPNSMDVFCTDPKDVVVINLNYNCFKNILKLIYFSGLQSI